ncbi:MAG: ABC transporter substrate-binding protein [Confluentimicrobium sp.]|nr:ABC transporter substrate-binding protein [Actibacterium sp.]
MEMRNSTFNLNRRSVLKAGVAAGTVALTAPYVSSAEAAENVLYVNTWGGAWEASAKKHLFDPFTADTGVEIRTVSPVSLAKLAAQKRSGVYEFDVTTLGVAPLAQASNGDLIETAEGVVSDDDLFPGALSNNGVASHAFGNNLVYRNDIYGDAGPQSWADFWDVEKFPGDRSLQKYAARIIAFALLADGVPKDQLFPYDLDRAFASLDKIKPHIVNWWSQGPQATQMLRDAEVSVLGMWPQYAKTAIDEGTPGTVVWNECLVDTAYWVVAKGTPRAEMAWEFVKSAVKPERVGPFAASSGMGPVTPAAVDFVDPAFIKFMPTAPQYKDMVVFLKADGIAGQLEEMDARFADWLLS